MEKSQEGHSKQTADTGIPDLRYRVVSGAGDRQRSIAEKSLVELEAIAPGGSLVEATQLLQKDGTRGS